MTQTVTAIVTGVNVKTGTWSVNHGATLLGTNPCVLNEPCTIGVVDLTAETDTLTFTPTNGAVSPSTSSITFTASPTPATTHPRLYITAAMLPALQAKAATGSPMYTAIKGPTGYGYTASEYYTQLKSGTYTNNGTVYDWSWSCESGTGLPTNGGASPYGLADAAQTFAFMALVDPNTSTGTNWGCYGHDVMMYIINQFNSGAYTPGQDEVRNQSAGLGLSVDWLLGGSFPALSSSGDITAARTYVAGMLKYVMIDYLNGWYPGANNSPGWYNSSNMFPAIVNVRNLGNNYSETRFWLIPALALTFNDNSTDDPPLTNTCSATPGQVCPDWSAYNMHAYFTYWVGSILYSTNLHLEDPNVTWQAYQAFYANLPSQPTCAPWSDLPGTIPCFGDGRGGESSEGNGYGFSLSGIRTGMNVVWTAGYADPLIYGPQMSLATSSFWDMHNVVLNEFLTGMQKYNTDPFGQEPSFGVINTGDESRYQTYPNNLTANSATMVFDTYTGRTDRMSSLEWPVLNTAYGGPAGTLLGCSGYCGFNTDMRVVIANGVAQDLFIALPAADPVASPPADPRPSMPYDLWNGSYNQHQMVRTGFGSTDTLVSITCGNTMIDHEHGFCGRIEVYSGNEWITKGRMTGDDYNSQMHSSPQSNTLSIVGSQPNCGNPISAPSFFFGCAQGGQYWLAQAAGFVLPRHSELAAYAANIADMTNQYNQAYQVVNFGPTVTAASRSTIILKGLKQVIFYDRGASTVAGDMATYFNTTGTPTITGNVTKWTTQSGTQDAYVTSLLPASLIGTGGQLVNATVTTPCSSGYPASMSVTGTGSVFPWNNGGSVQWGSVVPGSGYASAPALTISGCSGGVGNTTVNSLTAVVNNTGLTQSANDYNDNNNDWEVVATVEDNAGSTTSAHFLNYLQWGAHGFSPTTPTLVSSSAGQNFDGALVGSTLVMFERAWPTAFSGTTFAASGATTIYVSDLTPNTSYPITGAGTPGTVISDTAGVATFAATGTGIIVFGSGLPAGDPPTFSPVAGTYAGAQTVAIGTALGGVICYNTTGAPATNGTTGCAAGSTLYTGTVSVSSTEILYAVAGGTGYLDSAVSPASYTITTTTASAPIFSPSAGVVSNPTTVTASTSTSGCGGYIYFDTSSTPTTNQTTYSVTTAVTLHAYVHGCPGYADSTVASAGYTIGVPTVVSIVVTPSPVTVGIGSTQQFSAACHYSDSSVVNCTSTATWTSSNTAVATIASGGLATTLTTPGPTTISAVYSGITGTGSLTSQNQPNSAWNGFGYKGMGIH
jgi:hypothetical protein